MKFLVGDRKNPKKVGLIYLSSCSIGPTPPVFKFETDHNYVLELSVEEYVFRGNTGGCTIGIQPNDAGVWKVGALVAKRHAIIIDNGMVGNYADNRVNYLAFGLEHGKRKTHLPKHLPKLSAEQPSASEKLLSNKPEHTTPGFDKMFAKSRAASHQELSQLGHQQVSQLGHQQVSQSA